ncbi:MAG: nuclear transport factor 2 family protein [Actinomycetota bacterium]
MWELVARESIRDLVARYNANGDTGRFDQVMELFAPDAVMEIAGEPPRVGHDEIRAVFTGTAGGVDWGYRPPYLRHVTGTHQIDLVDETSAVGRCYYFVLTAVGLDHWGRYVDEYRVVDGAWRFARRRVTTDGRNAETLFARED